MRTPETQPAIEVQGKVITEANSSRRFWGLLQLRQSLVPTWRGWLLLLLVGAGFSVLCIRFTYPFLALSRPLPGGVLVVEGWAPDYALRMVVSEFNRGQYDRLYVTGVPLERGAPLSEYGTYADLGAAILLKLGLSTNVVQAVPAPAVIQDRTFASAKALRDWMRAHGIRIRKLNLLTVGPHARRSRLLFAKVFIDCDVGVVSLPVEDYDAAHWWHSSAGVRTVISEALAYVYARFWFDGSER